MYSALRGLRRRVLRSPHLDSDLKLQIIRSLLYTRLMFHAGTWPRLKLAEEVAYCHDYVAPLRAAALMENLPKNEHKTDKQVLVHMSARSPAAELIKSRVTLFLRISCHAPPLLINLLFVLCNEPKSWASALFGNLALYWQHCDQFSWLPSPLEQPGAWIAAARERPRRLKGYFLKCLPLVAGTVPAPDSAASAAPRLGEYRCEHCDRTFPRRDMLLSHAARLHGYRNPAACRIAGDTCLACQTCFHTTARLYKHVTNRSSKCCAFYMERIDPLTDQQLADQRVEPPPGACKSLHNLPC